MGKTLHFICIFIVAQLLFACSTTDAPQYFKTETKERVIWQSVSEAQPQDVTGIDFRNGRLVNNIWIIDLHQEVALKQKLLQQIIEHRGTDKPMTLDLVIAQSQCTFRNTDCSTSSIDWLVEPGKETFIGFTGETKTEVHPYDNRFGDLSATLQVKQKQNIVTIPVSWRIKDHKVYVDLKPALLQSPFEPEKAILKVDFANDHHQYSHKVVFEQYIFNLLELSPQYWHKPDINIQQWLDAIAQCLPVGDFDCAIAYMLKIQRSGEQLPDSYYYHIASMYLMAGDSEKAKAYAQKYLATASSEQYKHQARAML
ncbi:hypothetical protein FE810_05415 [Thalassotalea litorea]|uniref:Tetratricopeptide repeat protein n=1 Tax=Thalassotalea litorea TaxID=2020715 RepID=A0A5R9INK5_9GAMM|nr:hypothetical protein [Thalassotalea litorea]TLU66159.1 hypothetical protein FE810_05415 [Thalassotalea litorea]